MNQEYTYNSLQISEIIKKYYQKYMGVKEISVDIYSHTVLEGENQDKNLAPKTDIIIRGKLNPEMNAIFIKSLTESEIKEIMKVYCNECDYELINFVLQQEIIYQTIEYGAGNRLKAQSVFHGIYVCASKQISKELLLA